MSKVIGKYITLIMLIAVIFTSCLSQKREATRSTYNVYKIDSIDNYYLVYAKKGDSLFKIVSKKENVKKGKRIELNKIYLMNLHSRKSEAPTINGVKIAPVTIIDVMCYNFENDTKICTDRKVGIYDLYTTPNLRGLLYIKN